MAGQPATNTAVQLAGHPVIPLLLVSNFDGLQEYICLECYKPVSRDPRARYGYRHSQWRKVARLTP